MSGGRVALLSLQKHEREKKDRNANMSTLVFLKISAESYWPLKGIYEEAGSGRFTFESSCGRLPITVCHYFESPFVSFGPWSVR